MAIAGEVRDADLIPVLGRSSGGPHNHPLQYSCPEDTRDGGSWQTTDHRVSKSQTQRNQLCLGALSPLVTQFVYYDCESISAS